MFILKIHSQKSVDFLENGAYDSKQLHNLIKELNFKKMITNKNIRNLKDTSKLDSLKLKKRGCVEHSRKKTLFFLEARLKELRSFNKHVINRFKQFKKIQLRYDRYSKNFISYIFMSTLSIVIKNTWI